MISKPHCRFFSNLLGENFSTSPGILRTYSYDSTQQIFEPDGVLFPRDETDIQKILSYCNEHNIIVIPRGAGSGMSGGSLAHKGGVILALEKHLNKILEIDYENMLVRVQPGVRNSELQNALKEHNLFYPPDPASMDFCTLGGNVAENAGGMKAAKYGTTKDYVLALRAVLPNGELIQAGKKTIKDVAGYNLAGILLGSEGTLAVISEITLKVIPKPKFSCILLASFQSFQQAMQAVFETMKSGITPVAMEFLDSLTLKALKTYRNIDRNLSWVFDSNSLLLCELDGLTSEVVQYQAQEVERIFKLHESTNLIHSQNDEEMQMFWSIRKNASQSITQYGKKKLNEDVTVPRSQLCTLLECITQIGNTYGFNIPCFGHAGDGNVHVNVMIKTLEKNELDKGYKAVEEIFKKTISLGGTLSGEHGIGISKSMFMHLAFSQAEIHLMHAIKKAFDPKNILNPYKMGL